MWDEKKCVRSDQDRKSLEVKVDVQERSDKKDECYICSKGFRIY